MSTSERTPPQADRTTERQPGRSFTDPSRPLGEEMIERGEPLHGVAERARAVAVLRKAEELMAESNPSGDTEDGRRRAIELACGRSGVKIEEFDRIVDHDEEVRSLLAAVMNAASERATTLKGPIDGPTSTPGN